MSYISKTCELTFPNILQRFFWLRLTSIHTPEVKINETIRKYMHSLTLNISFYSLSNETTRDRFGIGLACRFWKCHWLPDLIKNWMRYLRLKRRHKFPNRLVNFVFGCTMRSWMIKTSKAWLGLLIVSSQFPPMAIQLGEMLQKLPKK